MKVLVLGGTRFIDRAIVATLLEDHEVTVLNRGSRRLWDPRIRQLVADRNHATQLKDLDLAGFDVVVDVSGTEPHRHQCARGDARSPGAAICVHQLGRRLQPVGGRRTLRHLREPPTLGTLTSTPRA